MKNEESIIRNVGDNNTEPEEGKLGLNKIGKDSSKMQVFIAKSRYIFGEDVGNQSAKKHQIRKSLLLFLMILTNP